MCTFIRLDIFYAAVMFITIKVIVHHIEEFRILYILYVLLVFLAFGEFPEDGQCCSKHVIINSRC